MAHPVMSISHSSSLPPSWLSSRSFPPEPVPSLSAVMSSNEAITPTNLESDSSVPELGGLHDVPSFSSYTTSSLYCPYVASTRITHFVGEDDEFHGFFVKAQEAISSGVFPELISEGSSGSYFVKDESGRNIAVFKPKDEEPFAELNPKWPKFFQRVLCFCCFGRACLIPNSGYLSETGASIVDAWMHLNVVPKTRVVKLASHTFYYSRCCGRVDVKPKEGSFQLFVNGYESAQTVFARWDYDKSLLSEDEDKRFTLMFQKMCVLDYVIRNTDRHMDNLLVKHIPGKELELAAIDNGLAFPVKHPESVSRLRTYPFRWAGQKWAQRPWDNSLRDGLLQLLTPQFVHELCRELKGLFRHPIGSNRAFVFNQLRVVRGQLWSLREALIANETPSQMSRREPVLVTRRYKRSVPCDENWNKWFRVRSIDYRNRNCC